MNTLTPTLTETLQRSLAPDGAKLIAFVEALNQMPLPEMSTENGEMVLGSLVAALANLEGEVNRAVGGWK